MAAVSSSFWPNAIGSVSALVVGYFWLALMAQRVWQPVFPGAGFFVIGALALSILMSAMAGWVGSRRWYVVTAAAVGTLLLVGFRMR